MTSKHISIAILIIVAILIVGVGTFTVNWLIVTSRNVHTWDMQEKVFARNEPIITVAKSSNMAKIQSLLKQGYSVNASDGNDTVLGVAALTGNTTLIKWLMDKGADPSGKPPLTGDSPLVRAVQSGKIATVRLLVDHGANVNAKDNWNVTVLMCAIRHPNIVRLLIEHGVDVNAVDYKGRTALSSARQDGNTEVEAILLQAGAQK